MKLFLVALPLMGFAARVAENDAISPISRVVHLLQNLALQVEHELDKEEGLYETFVCWGKSIIKAKTASNAEGKSRKRNLETYVADLDAGRIELTNERVELEKEIKGLNADIESAEAQRAKELEDFEAASAEMNQAISALTEAVTVLKEGTDSRKGALLSTQSRLRSAGRNEAARVMEADTLQRAAALGKHFLSAGDARFLQRVLLGEAPEGKDHKMLKKKADFKMKYKARSGKILDLLKKLQFTFETSLREATSKEESAVELHEKLMSTKRDQLGKANDAKAKMAVEGAARGLSKSEAEAEIEALTEQMANDVRFIEQTKNDLKTKEEEWAARKTLRLDEIKAINEAINVLHNDDARDLFKRSLGFVQLGSARAGASVQKRDRAAAALAAAAKVDARVAVLARRVATGHFDEVLAAIDKMITTLKAEEEADLGIKEKCEQDRAEDTREASVISRDADEITDAIAKLKEEIEEIKKEIERNHEAIEKMNEELEEAKKDREAENAAWQVSDAEATQAIAIVGDASQVLVRFYKENGLSLVQGNREPEVGNAGEAPPPPPSTWEAPYAGAKGESTGIIEILKLVQEDMEKDQKSAAKAEKEAEEAYKTFKSETEAQIAEVEENINNLEKTQGEKEEAVTQNEEDRNSKKELLKAVMDKIAAAEPGCNFYLVNFNMRTQNRQTEIEGLMTAKHILKESQSEE